MVYHRTNFGCKRISKTESSEEIAETALIVNLFFSHDTPADNDASLYHVQLQMGESFRKYRLDKIRTQRHRQMDTVIPPHP